MSRQPASTGPAPGRTLLAGSALATLLVLAGGAPAALALPPGDPEITGPPDNQLLFDAPLTVYAEVGDWADHGGGHVRFTVANSAGTETCDSEPLAQGEGPFTCDIELAMGDNVITAVAVGGGDPSELSSGSDSITVRRAGTQPVAITSPADGAEIEGAFLISGTGPAIGHVDVARDGGVVCDDVPIAADGGWACEVIGFPGETSTFTARPFLANGAEQPSDSIAVSRPLFAPDAAYQFGPASFSVQASGQEGTEVVVDVYEAVPVVGELGEPAFEFVLLQTCPENPDGETAAAEFSAAASQSCAASQLTPGIWNSWIRQYSLETTTYRDDYIRIPPAPANLAADAEGTTVRLSGTAEPGDRVTGETTSGADVCAVTVPANGDWACEFAAPPGTHAYRAFARSQGWSVELERVPDIEEYGASYDGISAMSGTATVTVAVPPPPPADPPVPASPPVAPAAFSLNWSFTVSGSADGFYRPGDAVRIDGTGLPEGTAVSAELHSTPVHLGSATADADGAFSITSTIPADVEPGVHTVVVTASPAGADPVSLSEPVEITPVVPAAEPGGDTTPDDAEAEPEPELLPVAAGTRADPAAASVLTDALPTLARLLEHPLALALAGGLALALLFLVAIPTELLGATLSSNTHRLGRGFAAIERATARARDWFIDVTGSRALAAAILVVGTSIIFGFSDPAFGFDVVSVRLVLSLAIAFFLLSYVVGSATGVVVERVWRAPSLIDIQPAILVFAVLGVVVSRGVGFAPGILIGVVIGLELLRSDKRAELGAALVQFGLVVGLSVAAWLGYSLLATGGAPEDFWSALLVDTLAAVAIEGLTAALIAIVPLRFLDGRELFDASKSLWAAAFVVIAVLFCLLVLPTALEGTEVADIGVWTLVLVGFATLAFAAWAFFAWRARREETERNTAQRTGSRR